MRHAAAPLLMDVLRVIDLIKRNVADLISLFVVPIFVALLPWSIGFRVLKGLARYDRRHRAAVEQAWQAAKAHLPEQNEADWKRRFRLLRLLERTDTWLVLFRSSRWWARRIDQVGEWPKQGGPFVLLTYHWGGGQWVWRQLHHHDIQAHFLAKRAAVSDLGAGRVSLWYARFRELGIRRPGNREIIYTGGSSEKIQDALRMGRSVVGMMDVPAASHQASLQRPLLDGAIRFPIGLARLANELDVPVVVFSCAFDINNGRRMLNVISLPAGTPVETTASVYVQHLGACLQAENAFWQIWQAAPLMFAQVEPDSATAPQAAQLE
ncbi:MAG TPA: hypothetical protein VFN25_14940 [Dokdonella sp.]|uniref:hypothetical protein n=1 Tax=Dokdonella sp. TaxID=2291710 RepID=UPI002D80B390|nr:hypothetical protein [Dokdonella sp.]HET9034187.1 hypothetical protein [Dokdonella sp.]